MSAIFHCAECGALLPANAPKGLCPRCALEGALALSDGTSDSQSGTPTEPALDNHIDGPSSFPALGRFGDYELLEEIARGGMGVVYRARQIRLGRDVALKMILAGRFATRDFVRRFRAEAGAAAALQHPNIVAIHDVGVHEGQHYFSMDYVEGQNLAQLVGNRPLLPAQAAGYVKVIAEAIHYAHQQGILHRDLKPSNVLIDAHDQPRVTDFGLAKRLESDSSLTLTGQLLGSPHFMPPEQAGLERGKVGRASDVYGLGGILYFLLTARAPFQGESIEGLVTQVLNDEPVAPRLLIPTIPRDLETICLKCLEKDPARRYRTALDLAEELERVACHEPILARPVGSTERAWRWCRRKPGLALALATAAVLLAIVAIGSPIAAYRINAARIQAAAAASELRINVYAADMRLAQVALDENIRGRAVELLRKHAALPGNGHDLRGLEWRYLWAQTQGDELHTFDDLEGMVGNAIFSPDGALAAAISRATGAVKIWNVTSKRAVFESAGADPGGSFENPSGSGRRIAFSPNGQHFAVLRDGSILIRDTRSWRTVKELDGATQSLVYSPDGALLAACVEEGVRLWDTQTWEAAFLRTDLKLRDGWVFAAISPDGVTLAVASASNAIQLWDLSTLARIRLLPVAGYIVSLAFSPTENLLAAGDWSGRLSVWNLDNMEQIASYPTGASFLTGAAFSPDGGTLALAGADQSIVLWDVAGQTNRTLLLGHHNEVWDVMYSPEGGTLVSASKDGTVKMWNAAPDAPAWEQEPGVAFAGFEIAGYTSRRLASFPSPTTVEFWKVADGKAFPDFRLALNLSPDEPLGERFTTDGRLAALAQAGGGVAIYDCPTGRLVRTLDTGDGLHVPLTFSPDRKLLVLERSSDLTAAVWDLDTGAHAFDLPGYRGPKAYVQIPRFSPDGRLLAYRGPGATAILWDVASKRVLHVLRGHMWDINATCFSPDGGRLLTTSIDNDARIWDAATGRQSAPTLKGHSQGLRFGQFTPDGRTVLTADQITLRLWNAATGREMIVLKDVFDFFLADDGDTLVLRTDDGRVRLVRIPTLSEIDAERDIP